VQCTERQSTLHRERERERPSDPTCVCVEAVWGGCFLDWSRSLLSIRPVTSTLASVLDFVFVFHPLLPPSHPISLSPTPLSRPLFVMRLIERVLIFELNDELSLE
jgi:hypothetical protein